MVRPVPNLLLTSLIAVVQTGCWSRCGTFAGTWPLDVDLDRIRNLAVPEEVKSIKDWFPWMELIHSEAAVRGRGASDGIVDELSDSNNRAELQGSVTSMFVSAVLYRGLHEARAQFDIECRGLHQDWFEQDAAKEISDGAQGEYCVSNVVRLRNDPEGGCLAIDTYGSFVTVRRGRIVLSITTYARTRDDSGAATRDYLGKLAHQIAQGIVASL